MSNGATYLALNSTSFSKGAWCLNFQPLYKFGLLTGLSNGEVHLLDWSTQKSISHFKSREVSINAIQVLDSDYHDSSLFAAAALDSVRVYDVRSDSKDHVVEFRDEHRGAPFLSLDSRHGLLACGTELLNSDSTLLIYDIRNWRRPLREFHDIHNDDITSLKFHPSDSKLLLSGSTDGYVNVYDLTQQDEDDVLHQVINFASIHSCGWLAPRRIFSLSHMETFEITELNDKSEKLELKEPKPLEFGDIRELWGCDYTVDIYPGFVATGRSQEGSGELKILPMEGEKVNVSKAIAIKSAHGDDVVRDVLVPETDKSLLYSCGEDGMVKTWKYDGGALQVPSTFWDYTKKFDVFDIDMDTRMDPESDTASAVAGPGEVTSAMGSDRPEDEKSEESGHRHKRRRKEKEKKRKSEKKPRKSHRYNPY